MGLIVPKYSKYSGADSASVQQVQWGWYCQCTAGTLGLIASVYSRYSGSESVSVQQVSGADLVSIQQVYWP